MAPPAPKIVAQACEKALLQGNLQETAGAVAAYVTARRMWVDILKADEISAVSGVKSSDEDAIEKQVSTSTRLPPEADLFFACAIGGLLEDSGRDGTLHERLNKMLT